jgi:hypothetical protein
MLIDEEFSIALAPSVLHGSRQGRTDVTVGNLRT